METIPLEQIGRITRGPDKGKYTLVLDDSKRMGGYLVFLSAAPDVFSGSEIFDFWVERYEDLPGFFEETGWEVQWLLH